MDTGQIESLLQRVLAVADSEPLADTDVAQLRQLAGEAPYFTAATLLLLRHGALNPDEEKEARGRLALACPDRRTLLFARYGAEWFRFYPDAPEPEAKETNDVIDTFLATYGSCTPEEEAVLERMIFNPTPDYGELLAREEAENLPSQDEADPDSQDARINAFILSRHPAATQAPELLPAPPEPDEAEEERSHPVSHPEPSEDSLLSESLAKIFIKRRRYEKAYEIISGLNLKFPKKSAYFADQLRFLQKLIVNQRRFDELNGSSGATEK